MVKLFHGKNILAIPYKHHIQEYSDDVVDAQMH